MRSTPFPAGKPRRLPTHTLRRRRSQTNTSRVRPAIVHGRGPVKAVDQTRPVFEAPLAARADRQMSRPLGQEELSDIKCKRADLVFRVTFKILLLKRRPSPRWRQKFCFPFCDHVLKLDLTRWRLQPEGVILGPEILEKCTRIQRQ